MGKAKIVVKVRHRDLVKTVLEAIEITECAFCWKMQSGLFKDWRGRPAGVIGRAGVPDICGITRKGKFLGVEIKVGRDKQSSVQRAFETRCEESGAHYIIVNEHTNLDNLTRMLSQI